MRQLLLPLRSAHKQQHAAKHDSRRAQNRRDWDFVPFGAVDLDRSHIDGLLVGCIGKATVGKDRHTGKDQQDSENFHREVRCNFQKPERNGRGTETGSAPVDSRWFAYGRSAS